MVRICAILKSLSLENSKSIDYEKIIDTGCLFGGLSLGMTACKTTEENYQRAYDVAKAKRQRG